MSTEEDPDYDDALPGSATELAPSSSATEAHTAWALDDGPEWKQPFWTSGRITAAAAVTSAILIIGVSVLGGYTLASRQQSAPADDATGSPVVKAPPLDGLYRLDYLTAERKSNGTAAGWDPDPERDTRFWAFRTACDESRCSATGVGVLNNDHAAARVPPVTAVLHYVDGMWQQEPAVEKENQHTCIDADGSVGPGQNTEQDVWSLEPQSGGIFRGTQVTTILSGECGLMGLVLDLPLIATRIGDVPPGLDLADPATVGRPAPPLQHTTGGLDGLYRLTINNADQTVNGRPATGSVPNRTELWAFQSACTDKGCAAVAAQVFNDNPQQNNGNATVLKLAAGHWSQEIPSVTPPQPCPEGPESEIYTIDWSLVVQPDSGLRGVSTAEVLTDGCGFGGNVYKTPLTGVRTGDVSPSVVLADPLIFAAQD